MSERYNRIFSLSENLYAVGSPIVIKAGALLRDNDTSWLIAQLKLRNISNKVIKLVKVEITCFDSMNRPLDGSILYEYLDLHIARDVDFGTQNAIKVSNTSTRSYSVRVVEVGFADNTVWSDNSNTWEPIPKQTPITSIMKDHNAVQGYKAIFGTNANMAVCEYNDLWLCACGEINHIGEESCFQCHASLEKLNKINEDELVNEGIYTAACKMAESTDIDTLQNTIKEFNNIQGYKDSQSFAEKCDAKILELQNADKAKKAKRKKFIKLLPFICAIIAFIIVLNTVIIPNGKYNDAVALMEKGLYYDAITAFVALDGYKDSNAKIEECYHGIYEGEYNNAIDLMNAGQYEAAIRIFETLNGYKDSSSQITEAKYQIALSHYNNQQFDIALKEFNELFSYKNSSYMAKDCNYEKAMLLYNQRKFQSAFAILKTLGNHRDAYKILNGYVTTTISEIRENPADFSGVKVKITALLGVYQYEEPTYAENYYDGYIVSSPVYVDTRDPSSITRPYESVIAYTHWKDKLKGREVYIGFRIMDSNYSYTLTNGSTITLYGTFTYNIDFIDEGKRFITEPHGYDILVDKYE